MHEVGVSVEWRARFEVPTVTSARVARGRLDRGVVISDVDGKYEAHAWDRNDGTLRAVTPAHAGVLPAAISPDGEWIYALVEREVGTETGHLHRFPFMGGPSEDLTVGLADYTITSLQATDRGLVAEGGVGGQTAVIVVDDDVTVLAQPSFVQHLAVSGDGSRAGVTCSMPGRGLTPMLRVLDLLTGVVLSEANEMRGGPLHEERVAVAVVDGDWMRPGIWDGQEVQPLPCAVPGDVYPVDWSTDGTTILLLQRHRSRSGLLLYDVGTEHVASLPVPPGGIHPFTEPVLDGGARALAVWSDAATPPRVLQVSADGPRTELAVDDSWSFLPRLWEEFTFSSADGTRVQGWLLRPPGDGPWPTVLHTHGGPTHYAGPTFDPYCGAWSDAGYAVASINYRGSTTFGRRFQDALTENMGGPDVEDVVAAYEWLVDNGVADRDGVIKNGYSYGGYLTLQTLGAHPGLWAAGIAGAPIADFTLLYEDSNDALKGYARSMFGGTPEQLPEKYVLASPRTYARHYEAPLHISIPENDTRTSKRQVDVFVEDLRAAGKHVETHVLKGGHGGYGKAATVEMFAGWIDFAARQAVPPYAIGDR